MMSVILMEDVYNLGKAGEVVKVRPGYGRNFLLPRQLAVLASRANIRQLEHEAKVAAARQAKLKGTAEEQAKGLSDLTIQIARKVGEQDKLYGSVTVLDIAEAIAAKGKKIDRRHLHLAEPIKTIGSFEVELRLHREVTAKIKVEVVPEAPPA